MKVFNNTCAQGDIMFRRVMSLPADAIPAEIDKRGTVVVGKSETHHDHVFVLNPDQDTPDVQMFSTDNPLVAWIKVNRPTALEHLRPFDTHEPIMFSEGVYEVRRQREYTPEGFRRVDD